MKLLSPKMGSDRLKSRASRR